MSFAHTMPGVQSEVYLDILGPPGADVTVTLTGPGVISTATLSGTTGSDGRIRLTWVINRLGVYMQSGTVGETPISDSITVE